MALTGHDVWQVPSAEDPFYYGQRLVMTRDAAGEESYTYHPLTPEDFLDPQEGDYFVQGTRHYLDCRKAYSLFASLHQGKTGWSVFGDLKLVLRVEGIPNPAPDVMVIPNVKDPARPRGVFDVQEEGTRPLFVLEIVSPRYREADREKKVWIYEQAGVVEYVFIDAWWQEEAPEAVQYEVVGYRLQEGRYVPMPRNERGFLYSAVNEVWIGIIEGRKDFCVIDARTGERIVLPEEYTQMALAQAQAEALARTEAEHHAQMALAQAQAEALTRAEAEHHAQEAEHRALALEAELARLREELAKKDVQIDALRSSNRL